MDKRNKRVRTNGVEAADEAVPHSSRASSPRSSNSIERLTEVMTNLLSMTAKQSSGVALKGDVVPIFDPADKEQSAESWCRKVDELRTVFNWSEDATIYFALSKLRGLAETWYKGLVSVKFSWDEWKEKLKLAFPSQRDYYESLQQLMRRKKRQDESYSKYYYEMLALLNQCKISGSDAVSCIIGGIEDIVVKMGAKAGNYQNPEALFQYLSSINNLREQTQSFKIKSSKFRLGNRFKYSKHEKVSPKTTSKDVTCFKCGRQGHFANNCGAESEKRCNFCRKTGHIERNCVKKIKTKETVNKVA